MNRHPADRNPAYDLYDDLLAISRIEASLCQAHDARRRAPQIRDYSRLQRHLPGLSL